jgi:hypothetical protein
MLQSTHQPQVDYSSFAGLWPKPSIHFKTKEFLKVSDNGGDGGDGGDGGVLCSESPDLHTLPLSDIPNTTFWSLN